MTSKRSATRAVQAVLICALSLFVAGQACLPPAASPTPEPLTVSAGPGATINVGAGYTLQGSASAGTLPYVYAWSPATGLNNAALTRPTFTATEAGTFPFTLTVNDGAGNVSSSSVTILVVAPGTQTGDGDGGDSGSPAPSSPLQVDAGPDRHATIGSSIVLQGSVSGGDGNYVEVVWSPSAVLSNPAALNATFMPTQSGESEFVLTVRDSSGAVATDSVTITASDQTALSAVTWGANFAGSGYQVLAEFTRTLDKASAELVSNYRINGTETVASSAALTTDNRTVALVFSNVVLSPSQVEFDISVNNGIIDTNGAPVPQTSGMPARANAADVTSPTIVSTKWSANHDGSYAVELAFSEAMDRASVDRAGAYEITEDTRSAAGFLATLATDAKTVIVVFRNLALSRTSTLDVGVLPSPIKDVNGRPLTLATDVAIDDNPADAKSPEIVKGSVQFAVGSFPGGGYQVVLEYDEAMDKTTAEDHAAYSVNNVAASSATLGPDGRSMTLTFAQGTASGDSKLNIAGSAVKDINGRALATQTGLEILSSEDSDPAPGAPRLTWLRGDESAGYQIRARFNDVVDETTVEDPANWRISGTTIQPEVVLSDVTTGEEIAGRTAIVTFGNATMSRSTKVDVSVGSSIVDVNGNTLPQVTLAVAANAADRTAPMVVSPQAPLPAQPVWGDLDLLDILPGPDTGDLYRVSVVFSETMDASSATDRENYLLAGNRPTAVALHNGGAGVLLTFEVTAAGIGSSDDLQILTTVRDINGRSNTSIAPMPISGNPDDTIAPTIDEVFWGIDKGPYEVVVKYSEVMDADTAGVPDAYKMQPSDAAPSSVTLSSDGRSAFVVFDSFLFDTIADGLEVNFGPPDTIPTDANGQAFAGGGVTWPAIPDPHPATDVTGPIVASAVWAVDDSQYRVIATFNEALDKTYASTPEFYRLDGMSAASAQLLADSGGTKVDLRFDYVFDRHAMLWLGTTGPGMGVRDMHGNVGTPMADVTANPEDALAKVTEFFGMPFATAAWSPDYAGGGYEINVTFSEEALDLESAQNTANYGISGTSYNPISAVLNAVDDVPNGILAGRTVTLTFGPPNQTVGLRATDDAFAMADMLDVSLASSVSDLNGNFMPQILSTQINQNLADGTAPSVVLAFGVEVQQVLVFFSEAMDRTTVENPDNWSLIDPVTDVASAPTAIFLQADGMTASVHFQVPVASMSLKVSVGDTILDVNGQHMTEPPVPFAL